MQGRRVIILFLVGGACALIGAMYGYPTAVPPVVPALQAALVGIAVALSLQLINSTFPSQSNLLINLACGVVFGLLIAVVALPGQLVLGGMVGEVAALLVFNLEPVEPLT